MQKDVTLVVVCWNQRKVLELMLKSYVLHHYEGEPLKLILVDNHSTDDTWEWLKENQIPCYHMGENIGHENALNYIFDDIETKNCLIVDTDVEFLENVYERYSRFLVGSCKIVGDFITGDHFHFNKIKPRVGAWFLFTDIGAMKELGLKTFRDKTDWSYDVLSQYTEFVLENGFTIHHTLRLNKNIDGDIKGMDYGSHIHYGKLSWDIPKHKDREGEINMRMEYIIKQRLPLYKDVDLKGKFI